MKRVVVYYFFLACSVFALSVQKISADALHVPGEFASIQGAIDAAAAGDTVLVEPGTYGENLTFRGKDVNLVSTAGAEQTVIAASGGTAVTIGPNGSIVGFTITHAPGSSGPGVLAQSTGSYIGFNIIEKNSGGSYGSGVGGNVSSPTIDSNVFRNNTGSAVVAFVNGSLPHIANNFFYDNAVAAIDVTAPVSSKQVIINNTIVRNSKGIHLDRRINVASKTFRNNIIVDNTIGLEVVFGNETYNPVFENNLVFGNGTDYSGISDQTGLNGNISMDPLFVDAANNDFHLMGGSPAIDAGTNTNAPLLDFEGDARPIDGDGDGTATADIGADEARVLSLTQGDFIVNAYIDDPLVPPIKIYQLSNSSTSAVNWSASSSEDWIRLLPVDSGTLTPGATMNLAVSLLADAHDFTVGTHAGLVTISNLSQNEEFVRYITVNIYAAPRPPVDPVVMVPAHSSAGIAVDTILDWDHDSGTVPPSPLVNTTSTYSVFFGASATNLVQVATGLTNTLYDPGLLETDTTYYWQIAASNGVGVTTGPVWSFTTWMSGPLDHFEWGPIASNQQVSVPFNASIAAKDSFGSTVVGFNGDVPIRGYSRVSDGEHSMLGNAVHQNSGTASTISRGLRFRVDEDVSITHFLTYRGTNICLWTDDGTLLYEAAVTNAQGSWSETALLNPIFLQTGQVYRVSSEGGSYYRLYDDTPRAFGHGQILSSCYSAGGFPTTTYSSYTDLIDFRYAVGHQDPVAIFPSNAVGFVEGVWTGNVVAGEYVPTAFLRAEAYGARGDSITFSADYIGDLAVTLPENVDEGDGILVDAGEVTVSIVPASNLVVSLAFEPGGEASVPVEVVIPAGQTNVLFDLTVLDDAVLDGSRTSVVHAVSFGYKSTSTILPVHDNETATLTVSIPQTTYEGAGSIAGAVLASSAPVVDVVVLLTSNNPSKIGSGNVILPAGQTLASFSLPVHDDAIIDGVQTATVEAHVENWQSGYASVFVFDNETTGLDLQLPASLTEGDGTVTNAGTIKIPAVALTAVNVLLTCSDAGELIVPAYVTIPAGTNQVSFDVSVVDDAEADGTVAVSVLAQAPGYIPDSIKLSVADNDPHHLLVEGVANVPLFGSATITVSARTVDDGLLAAFSGEVTLSATGDRGPVALAPTSLGNMSNGTVSGSVSFNSLGDDVALIASAGGVAGTSAVFSVLGPQLAISPANLDNTLVVAGQTAMQTVVISNAGNANLEYEIPDDGEPAAPTIQNLVLNGDFEAGNTNFTSTYTYNSVVAAGRYFIGEDSKTWNVNFATTMTDHTSGSGLMLMADGKTSSTAVWEQSVAVVAGVEYEFSAWVASLYASALPVLEFKVDGQVVGTINTENVTWKRFSGKWTAQSSGTVVLSIRDTITASIGNDFAIDDIEFKVQEGESNSVVSVDTSLILHYTFDDDSGNTVVDQSGNGNDGVWTNTCNYTTGVFGQGLEIHGNSSVYSSAGGHVLLPTIDFNAMDEVTVALWVKEETMHNSGGEAYIWFGSQPWDNGTVSITHYLNLNRFSAGAWENPVAVAFDSSGQNEFVHYAVTYSNGMEYAYRNGVLVGQTNAVWQISHPQFAALGRHWWGDGTASSTRLTAVFDDVRVYNRALSQQNIQTLYNGQEPAPERSLEDGLVAYYPFNGDAADESGNGHDGTVNGATLTIDRFGNTNGAYYFDGVNDRIDLTGEPAFDFERTNSFSYSCWVKTDDTTASNKSLFSKMLPFPPYRGYEVFLRDGKIMAHFINTHNTNGMYIEGLNTINDGQWHCIMLTYDGSSSTGGITLYLDGALEGFSVLIRDQLTGSILNDVAPALGARSSSFLFKGIMDDIRLYNRVLSASEIQVLYNDDGSGGGGDPEPEATSAVVHYAFDGDATDSSGNGNDGIVEGATLVEDRDGHPNSAYAFDEGAYIRTTAATGSVDIVGQISMSGWINPSQFETKAGGAGTMRTIMRKLSALSFYGYTFAVTTEGRLAFDSGLSIYPNTHVAASGMVPLPTNAWSHVAMTYDGSQVLFYVNGVLADSQSYSQPLQSGPAATLCIGRYSYEASSDYFYGSMDELRLYDSVLSAAEVASQYSGIELPSGPWFSVDTASGTIPPGGSMTVTVSFDASGMTAGVYVPGFLTLLSNDPTAPSNTVPLSMLVLPPAPILDAESASTYGSSNTVSWSAVAGPVQYEVEVAGATNSTALQQSGWIAATNHTFDALATNTTYYYRARASITRSSIVYAGPWSDLVWSTQMPVLVDSDSDGLPAWWEQMYFGGATNANPLADSDGDGQSNHDEFIAGMNPTDPDSCFAIYDAAIPTSGQFVIYWDAVTGRVYSVHWQPSLTNAFESMANNLVYPQNSYTDTVHQAENSGFYNVEVELQ